MLDELNRQLIEIREKQSMNARLQRRLASAWRRLTDRRSHCNQLKTRLEAETNDVRKLEGLSLTALFYTILGSKDQQLEKERQELLAAKLKYDECSNAISTIKSEISEIQLKISSLGDLRAQHAALLAKKEEWITTTENPTLREYTRLSEQFVDLKSNVIEMEEALSEGRAVLEGLRNVIESLQSAKGWGTWDMLGGGLIATAIKHSKIDDARSWIYHVQCSLRRFQRELTDVNPGGEWISNLEIGGFEKFSDYFFDCLITDWIVQGKIKDSLEKAEQMLARVQNVVVDLQERQREMQAKVKAVMDEKRRLIESA